MDYKEPTTDAPPPMTLIYEAGIKIFPGDTIVVGKTGKVVIIVGEVRMLLGGKVEIIPEKIFDNR